MFIINRKLCHLTIRKTQFLQTVRSFLSTLYLHTYTHTQEWTIFRAPCDELHYYITCFFPIAPALVRISSYDFHLCPVDYQKFIMFYDYHLMTGKTITYDSIS